MRFLLSVLVALLLFPVAVPAQNKVRLSQTLESVRWNAAERGPLLAVAPATVETTEPLPTGRAATTLSLIAPLFSRRIVSVGTITVLAPETMVVLNPHSEQQDSPRMERNQALRLLLPTFRESQWRKIGSDTGIGMGDMETKEQRELFHAFIASPLPVQQYSPTQKEYKKTVLLPNQLTGLRFRIQRQVELYMTSTGTDGKQYVGPFLNRSTDEPARTSPILLDGIAATRLKREEGTVGIERNHLKPGDLDFSAPSLNPLVRLSGIKTVGDAVKRCAAATRLELYVDGRMARLPLYLRADANASARSGDLLKGLCWMLTGTFRKVQSRSESALILTDALAGYGTRMAHTFQQRNRAQLPTESPFSAGFPDNENATPRSRIWQLLSDSDAIGFTPTGEIRQALDTRPGSLQLPPSALPDEILPRIERATEQHKGLPLNHDRISAAIGPQMTYLVPGLPPIQLYEFYDISKTFFFPQPPRETLPEPGPVPAPLTERMRNGLVLVAAPKTAESARILLQIASDKGIRQVWLESDVDTVRGSVGIGQGLGITVGAMVSLLRAEEKDNIPRDIDIFGKESDWYLSDAPETLAKVQRRLRDYAAVPGLAGLILTDTAPPGCGIPDGDTLAGDGSEMGYTPARRLAYLRSAGFDPIDLVRGSDEEEQPLPFMRDKLGWDETSATRDLEVFNANRGWGAVRYAANLALMQRLYNDLRSAHPALPILVRNRGVMRHWYGSWDKADTLPHFRASFPTPARQTTFPTLLQVARSQSQRILLGISYQAGQYEVTTRYVGNFAPLPDGPDALARAINLERANWKQDWDGLVLDLRTVSLATLPELLAGIE